MGLKPGSSIRRTCKKFGLSIEVALEAAGLFEIDEVYTIQRQRDIVFNFVKNRNIYREYLELETDVENSEYIFTMESTILKIWIKWNGGDSVMPPPLVLE